MSSDRVVRDLDNIVLNDRRLVHLASVIVSIACIGTAIFYLYTSYVGQYLLFAQIGVFFALGGSGRFIRKADMRKELPAEAIKSGTRPSMKKSYRLRA